MAGAHLGPGLVVGLSLEPQIAAEHLTQDALLRKRGNLAAAGLTEALVAAGSGNRPGCS